MARGAGGAPAATRCDQAPPTKIWRLAHTSAPSNPPNTSTANSPLVSHRTEVDVWPASAGATLSVDSSGCRCMWAASRSECTAGCLPNGVLLSLAAPGAAEIQLATSTRVAAIVATIFEQDCRFTMGVQHFSPYSRLRHSRVQPSASTLNEQTISR